MFCETRCFRYANSKCRHYRCHHVFPRCTWDAHKCAESSTRRKTTRAMTKNTNDDTRETVGRRHVSPYRFAVNSRISSLADFTTARKVSRTSSKWVPQGRSMLSIKRFLPRSINSLRNFPPRRGEWSRSWNSRLLSRLNVVLHDRIQFRRE